MEILCTKWLVTCFLTSLPPFCGLKVIDMLLSSSNEKQRASLVLIGVDSGEVLLIINDFSRAKQQKQLLRWIHSFTFV
ncbi:hypothetical protein PsorP6_002660 [Peronosclerospora sorghi]|uniref:Uncharacterized protein n=1 Tax=Peronosclerospora sorghi TaxID=230839 RepID=A0ACC0WUJ9_9STRA|nr:hypothetical protein PsorP6_002660 [Peronosclerospora sorghi]